MTPRRTRSANTEQAWPAGTVFTIGHSTLPIDRFIAVLAAYAIEELVDIRKIPRSRHNPQFATEALEASMHKASVGYLWMQGLGGRHHTNANSPNTGWRNKGFRGYADYMQTDAFRSALDDLMVLSRRKRCAIMCAESVPWRCHRSLVADALNVRGIAAVDIYSETNCRLHKLTPFAHIEGTEIIYPPQL